MFQQADQKDRIAPVESDRCYLAAVPAIENRSGVLARRFEDANIVQPSATVELRVHSLNRIRYRGPSAGVCVDGGLKSRNTGDRLDRRNSGVRVRAVPADDDNIASGPDIEDGEGDIRLTTLASLEVGARREGRGAPTKSLGTVRAAVVNQDVD